MFTNSRTLKCNECDRIIKHSYGAENIELLIDYPLPDGWVESNDIYLCPECSTKERVIT